MPQEGLLSTALREAAASLVIDFASRLRFISPSKSFVAFSFENEETGVQRVVAHSYLLGLGSAIRQ